jgi:putative DNA primase/helicase
MPENTEQSTSRKRERRSRGAVEPFNSIQPAARAGARSESPLEIPDGARKEAERQNTAAKATDSPRNASGNKGFEAIPEQILDRYYRIGTEFYLDNGELAFVNDGHRLRTRSENVMIVQDFMLMASYNGHGAITVTGTDRFRREAWAQAYRLGIEVDGYTPSEHDKKQLVRTLAREHARGVKTSGEEPSPRQAPANAGPAAEPPSVADLPRREPSAPVSGAQGEGKPRAYVGELLEHGRDHYLHNPREDMSYYVKLATKSGITEQWGVDLDRALTESKSHPKIGDEVALLQTGTEPVKVTARLYDEAGQFLGEEDKEAQRNQWQIEKREFFDERAQLASVLRDTSVSAQVAGERHPQLVGSYFLIKQAEEFAKQTYQTRAEQESFVKLLRERVADEIERGAALRTTQLRERAARSPAPEPYEARDPRQHERVLV